MVQQILRRLPALAAISTFVLAGAGQGLADGGGGGGEPDQRFAPPATTQQPEPRKPGATPIAPKKKKKDERKSDLEFIEGYKRAYALAHSGAHEAAFVAFKELNEDDHPDVANHLGYLSRKLGDYAQSKFWYERALAANPGHTRTWQYYGLWHLEQGNRLKAEDHLERIRLICGVECRDYVLLKAAIGSTSFSY